MTAALVTDVPERAAPVSPVAPVRASASERVRAAAIAPLWVFCVATWGVTSATMLAYSAVRDLPGGRRLRPRSTGQDRPAQ